MTAKLVQLGLQPGPTYGYVPQPPLDAMDTDEHGSTAGGDIRNIAIQMVAAMQRTPPHVAETWAHIIAQLCSGSGGGLMSTTGQGPTC